MTNSATPTLDLPADLPSSLAAALAAGASPASLASWQQADLRYGTDSTAAIDFDALFPPDQEDDVALTPRMAMAVHHQAVMLVGGALEHATAGFTSPELNLTGSQVAEEFPSVCRHVLKDQVWVIEMLDVFHLIGARVAAGQTPYPTCRADEMALHIVLAWAHDQVLDGSFQDAFPEYDQLRSTGDDGPGDVTQAFRDLDELLFEDDDVLELFHLSPADVTAARRGEAGLGRLHPRSWFLPFY